MAIPSGKYFQRMTIDGVTKDWDLADICESDKSACNQFDTLLYYKVNGNRFQFPRYPSGFEAYVPKVMTGFSDNNGIVEFPLAGGFTTVYRDPSNTQETTYGSKRLCFGVNDSITKDSIVTITRTSDTIKIFHARDGSRLNDITYTKNDFYLGKMPKSLAIFIQAAGGGGGCPSVQYGLYKGAGGGGSGAAILLLDDYSKIKITLGRANTSTSPDYGYDYTPHNCYYYHDSDNKIICIGAGGNGGASAVGDKEYYRAGTGGVFSEYSGTLADVTNGGAALAGVDGGIGGHDKISSTNGGDFLKSFPLYGSGLYGFSVANFGGDQGTDSTGGIFSGAGGGGAASAYGRGGKGGEPGYSTTSLPEYGAGGGGGGSPSDKNSSGARGGYACFCVWGGYSA